MAKDTTPALTPEVKPETELNEAAATATFIEDAQTGAVDEVPPAEPLPDTIILQPDDPVVEEVTQAGNQPEAKPDEVPAPAPATGAPKVAEINAEMNAGAARVQEHENRERMLASKRAKEESGEKSEEKQVADATSANKDL